VCLCPSSDVHRQSVHKLLLRFQNSVHRGFGANYNVSVKHSMLLTPATKRHVDLKRRILMRSKLHRHRWSNCSSAAPGVELARGDLIGCNLPGTTRNGACSCPHILAFDTDESSRSGHCIQNDEVFHTAAVQNMFISVLCRVGRLSCGWHDGSI